MEGLPDISNLKQRIDKAFGLVNEAKRKWISTSQRAYSNIEEAEREIIRMYKEAKVTSKDCDHPVIGMLPGGHGAICECCGDSEIAGQLDPDRAKGYTYMVKGYNY